MPAGRPEKTIDWEVVDTYLEAGSTGAEIASYFGIHHQTFYDRIKEKYNKNFTDYADEKRQKGNIPLRVAQYNKALEGDNTQLIWLGKVRLGQQEPEVSSSKQGNITINVNGELAAGLNFSTKALSNTDNQSSEFRH